MDSKWQLECQQEKWENAGMHWCVQGTARSTMSQAASKQVDPLWAR